MWFWPPSQGEHVSQQLLGSGRVPPSRRHGGAAVPLPRRLEGRRLRRALLPRRLRVARARSLPGEDVRLLARLARWARRSVAPAPARAHTGEKNGNDQPLWKKNQNKNLNQPFATRQPQNIQFKVLVEVEQKQEVGIFQNKTCSYLTIGYT